MAVKTKLLFLYATPIILSFSLLFIYLFNPEFYLRFIIHPVERETQLVEGITFISALLAGIILFRRAHLGRQKGKSLVNQWGICVLYLVAFSALFMAGEECSWGQSFFGWATPETYKKVSVETNLHNTGIPIQTLGSAFLIVIFFVLPSVWYLLKDRAPLLLEIGIPSGPAIFCIGYSFGWKMIKTIYRQMHTEAEQLHSIFYTQFIEQVNEHKEMLVAVGLLMYAIDRWKVKSLDH